MRYFLIVGEASGDLHASNLVKAIRLRDVEASFAFMGGDLLKVATGGVEPITHYREVAFMGLWPVIKNLGTIRKVAKRVQESLLAFQPDVVIPVDFSSFNLRYVLPFVRKHLDCPVCYYIAPKLWAWREWRTVKLKKYVDRLLCILPFEEEYFCSRGIPSTYVGNPCVDAIQEFDTQTIVPKQQIVILPGSRRQEIKSNLPVILRSIKPYEEDYTIIIAGAPGLTKEDYSPCLNDYSKVELKFGETYKLVKESRVALVTSGTATLETALLGTPQVVFYRMGGQRFVRWVFDKFFSSPFISLVNLILGRSVIPELMGSEVSVPNIRVQLAELLPDTVYRQAQLCSIMELKQLLGDKQSSALVAEAVLNTIEQFKYGR